MDANELERLLSELTFLEDGSGTAPPADTVLHAYREGRLDSVAAQRVERALATSAAARTRLATLADIRPATPPQQVRRQVLQAVSPREAYFSRRRWWWPAVAAMAAALLVAVGLIFVAPPSLPVEMDYEVVARGLAQERSLEPQSEVAYALPDTRVVLVATPRGAAVAGFEVGLYRRTGNRILRIEEGEALQTEAHRGAVTFSGKARDLVGTQPGTYDLYVVVAQRGDLPDSERVASGQAPAAALAGGARRRVYPQRIVVVPEPATVSPLPDRHLEEPRP